MKGSKRMIGLKSDILATVTSGFSFVAWVGIGYGLMHCEPIATAVFGGFTAIWCGGLVGIAYEQKALKTLRYERVKKRRSSHKTNRMRMNWYEGTDLTDVYKKVM